MGDEAESPQLTEADKRALSRTHPSASTSPRPDPYAPSTHESYIFKPPVRTVGRPLDGRWLQGLDF